jgi:acetoin utilization deacetylase AcuC-like enzyme
MGRVGLAYSPSFLAHDTGAGHPERPARLSAIVDALHASGTWSQLELWEPSPVEEATLELVHSRALVASIRGLIAGGGGQIDPDTHASAVSWEPAVRSVGAVVEAVDRVSRGELDSAFCLTRPPGHHATPTRAMGFCLFNNVAIAAAWLLNAGLAERVAILDFDVHHGNGTQDAFYSDPRVLYVSTHQYPLYPGTGHWRERGVGTTVNISLPPGSGDEVFARALERIVQPVVRRFGPDFLLVSLGFDAFWDDPLASLRLSVAGYSMLLQAARDLAAELCAGRIVVALDGGYDLRALGYGADACCRLLLGSDPLPDLVGPPPDQVPGDAIEPLLNAMADLHALL